VGNDVAEAECEEGGSADVEVGAELCQGTVGMAGHNVPKRGTHGKVEHSKAGDEKNCPTEKEQEEGERTVDAVDLVAYFFVGGALGHEDPGRPGGDEEDAGDSKSTCRTPGKDDGLEGVECDSPAEEQTGDECDDAQRGDP